jgi:hypothetical protein
MSHDVINLSSYIRQESCEKINRKGWVDYGEKNLFPQYLHELYMSSVTHNALVYSIAQEYANAVEPPEIVQGHNEICLDLKKHGGFYLEVNYSVLGTIARVRHIPFESIRLENNETPSVAYYSLDWERPRGANTPIEYPIYNEHLDYKTNLTQIMPVFMFVAGNDTYPRPDYIGGVDWIEMESSIASYHVNNIRNGFSPVWAIQHHDQEPTPEEKAQNRALYERTLTGTEGSKLIVTYDSGKENGVEFKAFEVTDEDKKYEFLSKECTDKIMIAHGVVNPMMFGVAVAGKLGGGEETVKADEIFNRRKVKPVRKLLAEVYGIFAPAPQQELSAVLTDDLEKFVIDYVSDKGELMGDDWDYFEEDIEDEKNEGFYHSLAAVKLYDSTYRNPQDKSPWGDAGLYKLRYVYNGRATDKSRAFCKKMVDLTSQGYVYRYEDIIDMGESGVNSQFSPKGASTYNIFEHKGGVNCHHTWKRRIYFRKRDKGKFIPSSSTPDMENDNVTRDATYVKPIGREAIAPIHTIGQGRKLSKFISNVKQYFDGDSK